MYKKSVVINSPMKKCLAGLSSGGLSNGLVSLANSVGRRAGRPVMYLNRYSPARMEKTVKETVDDEPVLFTGSKGGKADVPSCKMIPANMMLAP